MRSSRPAGLQGRPPVSPRAASRPTAPRPSAARARASGHGALFDAVGYAITGIFAAICALPILLIVSGSFTSEHSIHTDGYRLWPREISLDGYAFAFSAPAPILRSYAVTAVLTATGTLLGLFICAMTAYALQRPRFRSRNGFAFYFYFTTLFSGGLVPWYILMVRYLHMKNSFLSLLLPPLVYVFDIIVMRSFMRSVPEALHESARMDGAGEFLIFARVYMPVSTPALATVGLFIALRFWNDWYNALLFISTDRMFPLQYRLYTMLVNIEYATKAAQDAGIYMRSYPLESFKLAMTVIATGPIIFLYPFVQRYFIKGLTLGAIKG